MSVSKHLRFGRRAEWAALLMLWMKGYRLRHRKWRGAGGELDLVMRRGNEVVFVEVKARSGDLYGGAIAAAGNEKRRILARAAIAYLSRYELWERQCRFDLVAFERRGGLRPWRMRHIRGFFRPDLGRQL